MVGLLRWIGIRFSVVLVSVFLALLVGEIYLTIFEPQLTLSKSISNEDKCFLSDPYYFIDYKPNSVCHKKTNEFDIYAHINNLGFRSDVNLDLNKPEGKRILFLGDSFTYGQGVKTNQVYPAVVGSILKKDHKVEILNGGLIGTDTTRSYIYLRENIHKLKPNLVVFGLYLGNDLEDMMFVDTTGTDRLGLPSKMTQIGMVVDDSNNSFHAKNIPLRYRLPILRDSNLFILLMNTFIRSLPEYKSVEIKGSVCYLDPNCHSRDIQINQADYLIKGMYTLSQENNARFIVIIIPWESQLKFRIQQLSKSGIFVSDTNRRYMDKIFVDYFNKENISYIDLLDAFDQYKGNSPIFYPEDRHWTATGHNIAAQTIATMAAEMLK